MGINDRDYHRSDRREGGGFFSRLTPVVKWLLILNLGIYFLDVIMKGEMDEHGPIRHFGIFAIQSAVFEGRIWEFITFQFLHASVAHVMFNCLGIFFFGPWMERWWGSMKFLIFYLLCGVAGAVFFTLLAMLGVVPDGYVVGASAGLYGILIGVAIIAPELRLMLLFPPIELSMRQLAIALMSISVGMILLGYAGVSLYGLISNEGGQAGHLGGAILGYILMRHPQLLGRKPGLKVFRPKVKKVPQPPAPKLRPRSALQKDQDSAVDVILDKISREGVQSLTQEERDFLQKAAHSKQSSK